MASETRQRLTAVARYAGLVAGLAVAYVLLDFLIDLRPSTVHSSYRFKVAPLELDETRLLRQDNLAILVMRRSPQTIERLLQTTDGLQDPQSRGSSQPDFAANPLRSRDPEYFVSYGYGTDLGCPLSVVTDGLREVCSKAAYDFAGRARLGASEFSNLAIPDYTFSDDFTVLVIEP